MRKNHILVNKHCTKSTFYSMKEPRGVTLIALIVTIIVLLILAGVTLANITGGNSTIDKASEAKLSTDVKTELEELQSRINNSATKGIRHGNFSGSVDASSIKAALNNLVTDTSVITGNGPWQVTGTKTNTNYLIKQNYEVIPMPENTGTRTEMNVQIGDFVNYDAGTWTQEEIDKLGDLYAGENLPDSTTPFKFGGFKAGQSRNDCITPYSTYDNIFTGGWRVLSVNDDNSINIIHAGTPEAYYHPGATNTGYKSQYILSGIKNSSVSNDFFDNITVRKWDMYENPEFSKNINTHICSYEEITNIETNNNLRNINVYYWLPYANAHTQLYRVRDIIATIAGDYKKNCGIRPVVTLKAECLFQNVNDENTSTHDTQETAWNLVI